MVLTREQVKATENAHYSIQLGIYFSGMEQIDGAVLMYSDKIEDFFWNYAAQINVQKDKVQNLIERVIEFYRSRNRQPCIYITPFTKPRNISKYLQGKGFKIEFNDAWMFYTGKRFPEINVPSDFSIRAVKSEGDMEAFVKVFNEAYGDTPSENEPYGALPPYYGEALYASFKKPHTDKRVTHYLGLIGQEVIGIASLISRQGYAGIYNVGTSPQYRQKGIGSALSQKAIEDSNRERNKVLFLQTESGSYVERFYQKLGFATKFVGQGYVLSD